MALNRLCVARFSCPFVMPSSLANSPADHNSREESGNISRNTTLSLSPNSLKTDESSVYSLELGRRCSSQEDHYAVPCVLKRPIHRDLAPTVSLV